MDESKLTPWFPPNVKPAHPGVYQTQDSYLGDSTYYNLWDGKRWYYGYCELDHPADHWNLEEWPRGAESLKHWRGLAENPTVRPMKKKEAK